MDVSESGCLELDTEDRWNHIVQRVILKKHMEELPDSFVAP